MIGHCFATCPSCGSTCVLCDAMAEWDADAQEWRTGPVLDSAECSACGAKDIRIVWIERNPVAIRRHLLRFFPDVNPISGSHADHPARSMLAFLRENRKDDPVELAYFSFGIGDWYAKNKETVREGKWDGEIHFIETCMFFSQLLAFAPEFDTGVFAYEIAQPFGYAIAKAIGEGKLEGSTRSTPRALEILSSIYQEATT